MPSHLASRHQRIFHMYEHHRAPLISKRAFAARVAGRAAAASGFVFASLALGAAGYHGFEKLPWMDSFLNASMILAGMGPVDLLHTPGGKLFATLYALFSGVAFLTFVGVVFAPVLHRFLHEFHLGIEDGGQG